MNRIQKAYNDIRRMDEHAQDVNTSVNPIAAIIVVFVFIIIVTSYGKYEITGLLPLFLFPVSLVSLLNISHKYIAKRVVIVSPFIICFAVFNILFEQKPFILLAGFSISYGMVSFISILVKFVLNIGTVFIIVMWFGMNRLAAGLAALHVPAIFINQVLFMHRYLLVLIEEVIRCVQSIRQRSFNHKGVPFFAWGSFTGHLLLRTIDRAERIYAAMRLRLYSGLMPAGSKHRFTSKDAAFILLWILYFVLCRGFNIPALLGHFFKGG